MFIFMKIRAIVIIIGKKEQPRACGVSLGAPLCVCVCLLVWDPRSGRKSHHKETKKEECQVKKRVAVVRAAKRRVTVIREKEARRERTSPTIPTSPHPPKRKAKIQTFREFVNLNPAEQGPSAGCRTGSRGAGLPEQGAKTMTAELLSTVTSGILLYVQHAERSTITSSSGSNI